MFVNLLKFIHLLLTLSLLGSASVCLLLISSKQRNHFQSQITRLNQSMLILAILAMLTGSLLVHPKHFTFHTPWIQAAYLFIFIFSLFIATLILFKKHLLKKTWIWRIVYIILIIILIAVVHDAVTKTSLFPIY